MTEGNTARPGEPGDDDRLAGVPNLPAGVEVLAVVSVVLYALPDGTEATTVSGTAADGSRLPATLVAGMLAFGLADVTAPAAEPG
jgi:hypothetical protein